MEKIFYTCSGNEFQKDYELDLDEVGNRILKEVGKTDLQKLYNSHLSECDLTGIIESLIGAGAESFLIPNDVKVDEKRVDIDYSNVPDDLREYQELRAKVDHDISVLEQYKKELAAKQQNKEDE